MPGPYALYSLRVGVGDRRGFPRSRVHGDYCRTDAVANAVPNAGPHTLSHAHADIQPHAVAHPVTHAAPVHGRIAWLRDAGRHLLPSGARAVHVRLRAGVLGKRRTQPTREHQNAPVHTDHARAHATADAQPHAEPHATAHAEPHAEPDTEPDARCRRLRLVVVEFMDTMLGVLQRRTALPHARRDGGGGTWWRTVHRRARPGGPLQRARVRRGGGDAQ